MSAAARRQALPEVRTALNPVVILAAPHDALTPVDGALALDGADEVLRLMLAGDWSDEPHRDGSPAVVRVRSADEAWRIVLEPMAVVAQADRWPEMPVDATVTGEPSMLYLWLWRRGPGDGLTVDGDTSVVDQLHGRMAVATQ